MPQELRRNEASAAISASVRLWPKRHPVGARVAGCGGREAAADDHFEEIRAGRHGHGAVAGQGRVGGLFSTDRRFRHHIRLNYGHPRPEQLEPALKTVGRLAARLGKAV